MATASSTIEIEIKVRLTDRSAFAALLPAAGFRLVTAETMERNVLLDDRENHLRLRGELLRIRQYGDRWTLTHKAPAEKTASAEHKVRVETETEVGNGTTLAAILARLGYIPVFIYEKFRTEWTDDEGHIVVDVTPIGDFAELEGNPDWIDRIAANLGIPREKYLKASYAQLFRDWKRVTHHSAANLTFAEVGTQETAPRS